MKNIINSQKHHNNHDHLQNKINSHLSATYQPPTPMSKKSTTQKKFQYCINSNTIQTVKVNKENHHHFFNQFSSSSNNNSSHIPKPKKPTQKPIQNAQTQYLIGQYQKIISNLTHYYKYYEWMLTKQIQKHDAYFNEMIKIVEHEKRKSKNFLYEQLKTLEQKIQLKKGVLHSKISLLHNNNLKPFQKQKYQLQTQKHLQIPLFKINLKQMERFKQDLKKYLFEVIKEQDLQKIQKQRNLLISDKQSIGDSISLEGSVKQVFKDIKEIQQVTTQQIEEMTPIHPLSQQLIMGKPILSLEVQDLYCHQDMDMENILKDNLINNKMRKNKYQCQQDPIPQESQSHQDSFANSNVDPSSC